jgi:ferredoxin-NADP reductase
MPELPMRLLYSARTEADLIYADELADVVVTLTRDSPAGWRGLSGRIDEAAIAATGVEPDAATAFACGSNGFVEAASGLLMAAGIDPGRIRTERFGPTGF